jgi:hypothetical protein
LLISKNLDKVPLQQQIEDFQKKYKVEVIERNQFSNFCKAFNLHPILTHLTA